MSPFKPGDVYRPPVAPPTLLSRWRSAKLVGAQKHALVVRVRRGYMTRGYLGTRRIDDGSTPFNGSPIYPPLIHDGQNINCWKGQWKPTTPWMTLPNVVSANWTRGFDDATSGASTGSTLTVVMDDVAFLDTEGPAGLYHLIQRGSYSPMRGETPFPSRPKLWSETPWSSKLNGGVQIEVWEGYGTGAEVVPLDEPNPETMSCAPPGGALVRTWTGIVDNCEIDSHPDQITVTARDFSIFLTDQHLLAYNKALELRPPITFADKTWAWTVEPRVSPYHWILVDDAAEVVLMVLIWAGFQEFNVQHFGWSLVSPMHFAETDFLMDIIKEILAQGNFIFYMSPPSNDDRSIGIPRFEYQTVTTPAKPGMLEFRDTDMTEAMQVKWDLTNLPQILRYRGEINDTASGHTLGTDTVKRYMGVYWPPWSGQVGAGYVDNNTSRVAGIIRQFTQTLGVTSTQGLKSDIECYFACILAAMQYGLQMCTAQFQIAGLPAFDLNMQVSVVDEGSGVNSRMWVASIESDHQMGPNGEWHMSIGGALIDTTDFHRLVTDYNNTIGQVQAGRLQPPGPHG
jgi:hypothetical protein